MLVRCNLSAHFPAKEKVPDEISGISAISDDRQEISIASVMRASQG